LNIGVFLLIEPFASVEQQLKHAKEMGFTPWLQALADAKYSQYLSAFVHGNVPADEMQANVSKSRNYLINCRKKVTPGICR
jgi:hypothetical protein